MTNPSQLRPMLDKINAELRRAIALHEIYQIGTSDKSATSKFDKTYAANALNLIRDSLLYEEVMCLMRLWDERDAISIPNVVKGLRKKEIQEAIIGRRRSAMLEIMSGPEFTSHSQADQECLRSQYVREADQAAADARAEIDSCLTEVSKICAGTLRKSLKNFRDKVIAHTLLITQAERRAQETGSTIPNFRYGDEQKFLLDTIPLVVTLNALVDDLQITFEDSKRIWGIYSKAYWHGSTAPR
jgi:hypothetical protein